MENKSRLKRLYWSAAATVIAAAIWLPSPLGELFFFPRHQLLQDKILFTLCFLVAVCSLLFFFGRFVQIKNVALVLFASALSGLFSSVMIFMFLDVYLCYTSSDWRGLSSINNVIESVTIYSIISSNRGTFAFSAFTALVYRYLPKIMNYFRSKYRARQAK